MSDLPALRVYGSEPMFSTWAPYVPDDRIAAATASVKRLVDDVVAMGTDPSEYDLRSAVRACVQRFNELDRLDPNGWVFTIEREDIAEVIWRVIELAGFELDKGPDETWLEGREW